MVEDDWAALYAVASDPLIWEMHPDRERWQEPRFRAVFDAGLKLDSAVTIIDRTTGEIIGASRFHGYDPALREVEIGWTFLARSRWGGEINREVKRLMLDHAFAFADCVIFWIGEGNLRSRRAIEKIGGVLREGTRTRDGSPPHVIYEIRKPL